MSVKETLLSFKGSFTPSERKLVQTLLNDYPMVGLTSAGEWARLANVSAPTVVRLATKLGFSGYAGFQAALLGEVDKRFQSPLNLLESRRQNFPITTMDTAVDSYTRASQQSLEDSKMLMPTQRYNELADILLNNKGKIYVVGGRFSGSIATILGSYLRHFRGDVIDLSPVSQNSRERLVDMGPPDCLVVFDYRRYQQDVVDLAVSAAGQEVKIILFTDEWLSPIAKHAQIFVPSRTEISSAYDTMLPALMQVEVLFSIMLDRMDERTQRRFLAFEKLGFSAR
ncbi:MurR/RpiR family transcriptional regulator [Brucella oryzae]|uniref:MurR/RpiR family transcriptional regulator n=1 Tax=Brucella oryzae TaxID=335286 RepID=A0A2S7IWK5_9HYPH|nr:MurR/RpiR family transcriptional regulator [Brucella oryzae]PQA72395.1 MurR/RpiR family transcriptional regulator [Brucella oryzae]